MRIIFFGSDDFAFVNFEALIAFGFEVVACVTPPDRAKGRGLRVMTSPVKDLALQNHIPVIQPVNIEDAVFSEQLRSFESDLFVVISFGKILSREILDIPKIFAINVHGSLLPQYRGAAPINWSIINGDQQTGVSIIKLNESMDAGEIISQQKMAINAEDTSATLRKKMAHQGADLLIETVSRISEDNYQLVKQDLAKVSYAPKLTKELGIIRWEQNAEDIHNLARGLVPWPSAYTYYSGKMLKILETDIAQETCEEQSPGEVVSTTKQGVCVATGQGALMIKKVHLESSKPMDAKSFAVGHKLTVGDSLG